MKKIISLFLIFFLLLGSSACALLTDQAASDSAGAGDPELIIVPGDSGAKPAKATDSSSVAPSTAEAAPVPETDPAAPDTEAAEPALDENGWYNSKEEVALYIHLYGKLPGNYITKREAEALGWPGGSLEPYAPGKSIGGSRFGNYEGLLPDAKGRTWTECDIDTAGRNSRGAKRIVFSNDGLIYYTGDHYETFELLYGGDKK